jgi:hypothetical protein
MRQLWVPAGFDLLDREIDRTLDVPAAKLFGRAHVNDDGLLCRQQALKFPSGDARHPIFQFMVGMVVPRGRRFQLLTHRGRCYRRLAKLDRRGSTGRTGDTQVAYQPKKDRFYPQPHFASNLLLTIHHQMILSESSKNSVCVAAISG